MRRSILLRFVMLCLPALTAFAAQAAEPETVIVYGNASCIAMHADGSRSLSLDCLNASLKAAAEGRSPQAHIFNVSDAAGSGAPNQSGTFSFTATAIHLGSNFGNAVTPQRPTPPSTSNPIIGVK